MLMSGRWFVGAVVETGRCAANKRACLTLLLSICSFSCRAKAPQEDTTCYACIGILDAHARMQMRMHLGMRILAHDDDGRSSKRESCYSKSLPRAIDLLAVDRQDARDNALLEPGPQDNHIVFAVCERWHLGAIGQLHRLPIPSNASAYATRSYKRCWHPATAS